MMSEEDARDWVVTYQN